jgi:hypothetical protein
LGLLAAPVENPEESLLIVIVGVLESRRHCQGSIPGRPWFPVLKRARSQERIPLESNQSDEQERGWCSSLSARISWLQIASSRGANEATATRE